MSEFCFLNIVSDKVQVGCAIAAGHDVMIPQVIVISASWCLQKLQEKNSKKNQGIDLAPCSGTRDFYPDDMRMRNWLFGHFREVANLCGFQVEQAEMAFSNVRGGVVIEFEGFAKQEYDSPVLEHEELYKRKAGEEITAQMYNFVDKGDNAVTLRPEMTPSLARMILARERSLLLPLKWYSIPQCWRYAMKLGVKCRLIHWTMTLKLEIGLDSDTSIRRGVAGGSTINGIWTLLA